MEISFLTTLITSPSMLQWGHNFFVMEIAVRGKERLKVNGLQWGHNFFVMEMSGLVKAQEDRLKASMGP